MSSLRPWLPFLVGVAIAWPGTAPQSSSFQDLFARYRGTDAEAAIRDFAEWSGTRLAAEAQLTPAQLQDPWAAAALALFHLEADLGRVSVQRDVAPNESPPRVGLREVLHVGRAQALLETAVIPVAKATSNKQLLEFCRDWYIVRDTAWSRPILARSASRGQLAEARVGMSAQRHLGEDPEIQMLAGIEATRLMGPIEIGDSPYSFGSVDDELAKRGLIFGKQVYYATRAREAELAFRRALVQAPSLAEARLRLGRLHQVSGRSREAQSELERAGVDGQAQGDRLTAYLAFLFLGDLHEQAGRMPEAEKVYRAAIATYPSGTAARLALGDAQVMTGHADDGWATVRTALGEETRWSLRDPWALFPTFGYWQLGQRLVAMRRSVSRTPLAAVSQAVARALTATPAEGAEPGPAWRGPGPVFRSGVEGVRVDVLVTDGDRPVEGLTAADFVVTDNGVRQSASRSTTADSLSLALVIDVSCSLNSEPGKKSLKQATDAVQRGLIKADRISVVTAGDRIHIEADAMPSGDRLRSVLVSSQPRIDDFTALWDATLAGSGLVMKAPGRALVMVVSDGADNASWFARSRTIDRLRRRGVTLDGISIPWSDSGCSDIACGDINLREPALATGGMAFDAKDPNLPSKIADRFAALRQSYILFYTPTNVKPRKDGWHEIKVTLRAGLKGKVQARPGYYAPVKK